jgi:hypothetical protein
MPKQATIYLFKNSILSGGFMGWQMKKRLFLGKLVFIKFIFSIWEPVKSDVNINSHLPKET